MEFYFAPLASLSLPRQRLDSLPRQTIHSSSRQTIHSSSRQTIDSLPRQRLSNLAVGLSPRFVEKKNASRSDARIFDRRYATEFIGYVFRGLKQPTAKFDDRYAIQKTEPVDYVSVG
jgi:hypothetical protein